MNLTKTVSEWIMVPCNAMKTIAIPNTWFINENQARDVIGVKTQRSSLPQIKVS